MGALDNYTVLDLAVLVQGPQAAATLHDMGASVIKIELPGMGDLGRVIPNSPGDLRSPYPALRGVQSREAVGRLGPPHAWREEHARTAGGERRAGPDQVVAAWVAAVQALCPIA